MTTDILNKLIEYLQEVSPLIWKTLVKQVYVGAFTGIAVAIIFLILMIIAIHWRAKFVGFYRQERETRQLEHDTDYYEMGMFLLTVSAIVCGLIVMLFIFMDIPRFINPDFYAIKLIISALGGG